MPIELTPEQTLKDAERRKKEFTKEYDKLVEKYQIIIAAEMRPVLGYTDIKGMEKNQSNIQK